MKKTMLALMMATLPAISHSDPMTKEQGDAILKELQGIHQILAKQFPPEPPEEKLAVDVSGIPGEGNPNAPLSLVIFTDYQCPFCRRFELGAMREIKKEYVDTGKLRFLVRDLPLGIHPNAEKAAEAAHCAEDQGKFWEFRDKMIENSNHLEAEKLPGYAKDTGLDADKFSTCMKSGKYAKLIKDSISYADVLGISGTPTFVLGKREGDKVEGVKLIGAQPFPVFDQKIREMLEKKR